MENNVIDKILKSEDTALLKNAIILISEHVECCNQLEMIRALKEEIGDCHHDKQTAELYLTDTNMLYTSDVAKDYWCSVKGYDITIYDWCVLWGEMVRRHENKIRKWFPGIDEIGYEKKIFEECINFLEGGHKPWLLQP